MKIILERKFPLSLAEAVAAAARGLAAHPPKLQVSTAAEKQVVDFLVDRARFILTERDGFAYDEINAVLAASVDDLVDAVERVTALRAIRKTRNFEPLAVSFKRIRKILEKAGIAKRWELDCRSPGLVSGGCRTQIASVPPCGWPARRSSTSRRAITARRLQEIARLRPEVDDFFDGVMVMAEQEEVRRNRLDAAWRTFERIFDDRGLFRTGRAEK